MPTSARSRNIIKVSIVLMIAGAFAGIFFSPLRHHLNMAAAHQFVATMRVKVESLWWAPFAFVAAYGAGMIFDVPASLLLAFAGPVWSLKLRTSCDTFFGMLSV